MRPSLSRNPLFHLPFLLLIAGLVFWTRHEKAKRLDDRALQSLAATMEAGSKMAERNGGYEMNKINKEADAFKLPVNESGRGLAVRLTKLVDSAQAQLAAIRKDMDIPGVSLSALRKVHKMPDWAAIADSLTAYAGQDTSLKSQIRTCLFDADVPNPPLWWTTLMKNGSRELALAFLQYQSLKLNMALHSALHYIAVARMGQDDYLRFPDQILVLAPVPGKIPVLNRPFQAEILLKGYSRIANNLKAFINCKQVPLIEGKAHYKTVFTKPGEQVITTKFEVKNPLTGELRNYTRDFTLNVLPECTPSN